MPAAVENFEGESGLKCPKIEPYPRVKRLIFLIFLSHA